jgi:hypothetical protein
MLIIIIIIIIINHPVGSARYLPPNLRGFPVR